MYLLSTSFYIYYGPHWSYVALSNLDATSSKLRLTYILPLFLSSLCCDMFFFSYIKCNDIVWSSSALRTCCGYDFPIQSTAGCAVAACRILCLSVHPYCTHFVLYYQGIFELCPSISCLVFNPYFHPSSEYPYKFWFIFGYFWDIVVSGHLFCGLPHRNIIFCCTLILVCEFGLQ